MTSNRFQFEKREKISGHVGAIDFGNNLSVIMRAPTCALFWSGGSHYYSHRGHQGYGESNLSAYRRPHPEMVKKFGPGYRSSISGGYLDIGTRGGRLDRVPLFNRVTDDDWQKLADFIGEDFQDEIRQAINNGQTLLIEGGGDPFSPRPPVYHRTPRKPIVNFRPYCDECGMHSGDHFDTCSVFIR